MVEHPSEGATAATDHGSAAGAVRKEAFGPELGSCGEPVTALFRGRDRQVIPFSSRAGTTLLEALRAEFGFPSVCGGRAICGTCRVAVEDGFDRITPPGRAEARLLRVLPNVASNHRLACQIRLAANHDGICFAAAPTT